MTSYRTKLCLKLQKPLIVQNSHFLGQITKKKTAEAVFRVKNKIRAKPKIFGNETFAFDGVLSLSPSQLGIFISESAKIQTIQLRQELNNYFAGVIWQNTPNFRGFSAPRD